MAGIEVAEAYVTLLPSMRGMKKRISAEMADVGDAAGKQMGTGIRRRMSGMAKSIFAPLAAAAAAAGGIAFAKGIISEASDAQQSIGATEALFGKYADTVIARSKDAGKALGLSGNQYRESANLLAALFKNQGVAADELADKTDKMVTLGADLAAMYGGDAATAVEALTSAYKGEFNALEKYGISLRKSDINARLAAEGKAKLTGEALKQAEQEATTALIMEQSADAQGQAAREADTWAGQTQRLGAQLSNLKETLGSAILPFVTKFASFLNETVVPAIATFFEEMKTGEGAGGKFVDFLTRLKEGAIAAFDYFKTNVLPRLKEFGAFLRDEVLPRVKELGAWLLDNKDTLIGLTAAVVSGVAAFKAYTALSKAMAFIRTWTNLTKLQTVAQKALNFVMKANPIGIVVTAIGALIGWLVYLYNTNEDVRRVVDKVWGKVKEIIGAAWDWIQPKLSAFWGWLKETLIPALGDFWEKTKSVFTNVKDKIVGVWNDYISPAFDKLKEGVGKVVDAFEAAKRGIGNAWDKVRQFVAKPIVAVVGFINDGIIGGINWVLDKLGLDDMKLGRIKLPTDLINASRGYFGGESRVGGGGMVAMATGGILPGYSPGKDDHFFKGDKFDLALAGGEAIMRPEWTKAVGPNFVNAMNAAARTGGVEGVRKALGFSDGGILPGTGGNPIEWAKNLWDSATGFLADPIKWLTEKFSSMIPNVAQPFVDMSTGVIKKTVSGAKDWIFNALGLGNEGAGAGAGGRNGKGMSWQAIWSLIQSVAPEARMTSNYRPGAVTASGYQSYHGLRRAVDLVSPNMMATFNKIRPLLPWSELYYSPAGWKQMQNGRPHYPQGITRDMHFDHIHAAFAKGGIFTGLYDKGGYLPPGLSLVANKTGKPEPVLTDDQWASLEKSGGGDTFILNGVPMDTAGEVAATINYEVRRTRRGKYARR